MTPEQAFDQVLGKIVFTSESRRSVFPGVAPGICADQRDLVGVGVWDGPVEIGDGSVDGDALSLSDTVASSGVLNGCPNMDLFSWYVASFTWATLLITGTGGTDYYPNPQSNSETIVVFLLVVCGALLWTYVLALFCDMATNSNPGLTQFHQLLDGLNQFIHTHRLPKGMARRLREYLHQQKPAQLDKFAEINPDEYTKLQAEAAEAARVQAQFGEAKEAIELKYSKQAEAAAQEAAAAKAALQDYQKKYALEKVFHAAGGRTDAADGVSFFDMLAQQVGGNFRQEADGSLTVVDAAGDPVLDKESGKRVSAEDPPV